MARNLGWIVFCALICALMSISAAATVRPISGAHRSAVLELFVPVDGSFPSLEETYEALQTFEILGLGQIPDMSHASCPILMDNLKLPSSNPKDLFDALRVNSVLQCHMDSQTLEGQGIDVVFSDADGILHSIKALSQSDGRWRYDTSSAESSTYAAGIAFEALAGVVSLSDMEVDQSKKGQLGFRHAWASGEVK